MVGKRSFIVSIPFCLLHDLADLSTLLGDLKPDNLLLHSERLEQYPAYPTPKLSDFEFAIQTSPDDKENPQKYYDENAGQLGYKAPEAQSAGFEREASGAPKLLAHTNVSCISCIRLLALTVVDLGRWRDPAKSHERRDDR